MAQKQSQKLHQHTQRIQNHSRPHHCSRLVEDVCKDVEEYNVVENKKDLVMSTFSSFSPEDRNTMKRKRAKSTSVTELCVQKYVNRSRSKRAMQRVISEHTLPTKT